jgi:hypothetical protein
MIIEEKINKSLFPLSSNKIMGGEIKSIKRNQRLLSFCLKFNFDAQNMNKMTYKNPKYIVEVLPSLRNENTSSHILG